MEEMDTTFPAIAGESTLPLNSSNTLLSGYSYTTGAGQHHAHEPTCQASQDPSRRESAGKKSCDALLQLPASGKTYLSDNNNNNNNKDDNIVRCPCGVNEVIHVVMET